MTTYTKISQNIGGPVQYVSGDGASAAGTSNYGALSPSPPPQAIAAGFSALAFSDDFTDSGTIAPSLVPNTGYNWYWAGGSMTSSAYSVNTTGNAGTVHGSGATSAGPNSSPLGGILTITAGDHANATLQTFSNNTAASSSSGTGSFQHGYFEAYIQYDSSINIIDNWPAFWAWSLGASVGGGDQTEIDFFEVISAAEGALFSVSPQVTGGTIHNWIGPTDIAGVGGPQAWQGVSLDSEWHTYGCLWEDTGGGTGQLTFYIDNVQTGSIFTTPATNIPYLENNFIYLILGTGSGNTSGWPMYVDWVRVWQTGTLATPVDYEVLRWTNGAGFSNLGSIPAYDSLLVVGTSGDSSTVIGFANQTADNPDGINSGWYWTEGSGYVILPTPGSYNNLRPILVSNDGSVIVGTMLDLTVDANTHAFRWTEGTGVVHIGQFYPNAMTNDGLLVYGGDNATHIVSWTEGTGAVSISIPSGYVSIQQSFATYDCSRLGLTFLTTDVSHQNSFTWTIADGFVMIPQFTSPETTIWSSITGICNDYIVGTTSTLVGGGTAYAWKWTPGGGVTHETDLVFISGDGLVSFSSTDLFAGGSTIALGDVTAIGLSYYGNTLVGFDSANNTVVETRDGFSMPAFPPSGTDTTTVAIATGGLTLSAKSFTAVSGTTTTVAIAKGALTLSAKSFTAVRTVAIAKGALTLSAKNFTAVGGTRTTVAIAKGGLTLSAKSFTATFPVQHPIHEDIEMILLVATNVYETFYTSSGNIYQADAKGLVSVAASDISEMLASGCLPTIAGNTTNRPSSPVVSQSYFDTMLGLPIWWNGSNWISAAGDTV